MSRNNVVNTSVVKARRQARSEINNAIVQGVRTLVASRTAPWRGTMTELRASLERTLGKKVALPGSAAALRVVVNRVLRQLRSNGVRVSFSRATDSSRTRFVELSIRK